MRMNLIGPEQNKTNIVNIITTPNRNFRFLQNEAVSKISEGQGGLFRYVAHIMDQASQRIYLGHALICLFVFDNYGERRVCRPIITPRIQMATAVANYQQNIFANIFLQKNTYKENELFQPNGKVQQLFSASQPVTF